MVFILHFVSQFCQLDTISELPGKSLSEELPRSGWPVGCVSVMLIWLKELPTVGGIIPRTGKPE